jgi:hypothetical protein
MEKRYSQMTEREIQDEIGRLTEKARKAEQLGMVNEYAVLERKIAMAKCYLLNPKEFKVNETYTIEGDTDSYLKISYMNGVFAWGYRNKSNELEAFPISMLKRY